MISGKYYLLEEITLINKWIVTLFAGLGKEKFSSDDMVYNAAVLLDTIPGSDLLITSLHYASLSPNYQKQKSVINWNVIHLPPRLTAEDEKDIPPEVIANFDGINISHLKDELHWGLRQEGIKRFKQAAVGNADLDTVVNLYATASEFMLASIGFSINFSFSPFMVADVEKIKDPYYKSRCLFHIFSLANSVESISALETALLYDTVRQIESPNKQVRIWELCFPLILPDDLDAILKEIRGKIQEIKDVENRARAYGRLALLVRERQAKDWFKLAIETTRLIPLSFRKAQTLQELRRVIPGDEELTALFELSANEIADSWLRAKAYDNLGEELAIHPPEELLALIADKKELWAPVLLSGAISSRIKLFSKKNDIEDLWRKYTEGHSKALYQVLLKYGLEENRLTLSLNAAMAIDSMLEGRTVNRKYEAELHELLPLLSNASFQTNTHLARWKENLDPYLAAQAHLLSVEAGNPVTEEDISHLLFLIDFGNDLSRLRAYLGFASSIWNVDKARFITVKKIGRKVVEKVASHLVSTKADQHFKRLALRNFFNNIIHDDPEALQYWAAHESPQHNMILQEIEVIAPEAFEVYRSLFKMPAADSTKVSLFISSCKLASLRSEHVQAIDCVETWSDEVRVSSLYTEGCFSLISKCIFSDDQTVGKGIDALISAASAVLQGHECTARLIREKGASLKLIGDGFYRNLNGMDDDAFRVAQAILDNENDHAEIGASIQFVYHWLLAEIKNEVQRVEVQECLIRILSEVAKQAPNAFLLINAESRLTDWLVERFDRYPAAWARRGCIVLIGCTGEINAEILALYLRQSREDRDIWASTIESINKISYIHPGVLNDLLGQLFEEVGHKSAIRAYFASRILVLLGKHHNTTTTKKKEILVKLTAASEGILAKRNVYVFRGLGKNNDDVVTIHSLISLEKAYKQAIVEIIGIS